MSSNTKKIYIVEGHGHDDYRRYGFFDDKELAEEEAAQNLDNQFKCSLKIEVEEIKVRKTTSFPKGTRGYYIKMDQEGNVLEIYNQPVNNSKIRLNDRGELEVLEDDLAYYPEREDLNPYKGRNHISNYVYTGEMVFHFSIIGDKQKAIALP